MPADADVEGGYGAGGVGAGMGSGHGNADPDGPAFDPSAAPVGVNTDTVDIGFDFDNWGGIGIQGASTNQQNTNFDPSAAPVGVNTNQTAVDAVDVDYGYYDSPIENYSGQITAMQDLSPSLSTQQMAHSVFDPGISLSTQQMDTRTFSHNWDNPNTQFSPMEFGPQHQMSLSTQQLGQNVTVDPSISLSTQQLGPNPASLSTQQLGQNVTVGYVDPETTTLEAIAQQEHEQRQKEIALSTQQLGQNVTIGTPVEEVETNPNLISRFDQRQFYSALDDEDATEEAKALEVQGFLDHISRKNYTDTGLLSRFGIRSPQLTEREQIAQVKNFLGKHKNSIDALNKAFSKQINQNPGFRNMLPGYKAITGLMGLIGLEPQHVHPAVQALYDKMVDLGLMEKDTGEMTEAKKAEICNATTGYRWDSGSKSCVPINQDSDGAYNPYLGMTG